MSNQTNELMIIDQEEIEGRQLSIVAPKDPAAFLTNQQSSLYSSIQNDGSIESKVAIYNAINDSENSLRDHIGQVIEVKDIVAHSVKLVDEDGIETDAIRVVLVTPDGTTYHSVATGVASSLQKIFAIAGQPTYNPPIKISPVEKKTRKGFRTLTLRMHA